MNTKPLRPPLDRARIAEAALALIDTEGLEALSMRRLGQRLEVEAMSIYHHFPSKAHLLEAVAERLTLMLGPAEGRDWRERLADSARRYRRIAIEHPGAFPLLTTRRAASAETMAVYEQLMAIVRDAGFSGATMAKVFRLIGYFVGGAGHAEIATRQSTTLAKTDAAAIDMAAFPLMREAVQYLAIDRLDDVFEFGLETILSALEAELAKAKGQD